MIRVLLASWNLVGGFCTLQLLPESFTGPQDAAPVDEKREKLCIFTSNLYHPFAIVSATPYMGMDLLDEIVFEEMWLPYGDDKETDIHRLVKQHRLRK